MAKLLIHGSSWTVGAYKKSSTPNSDEKVKGGLADQLAYDHDVTNISVQDNMNLGIWLGLQNHLKNNSGYDAIIICQNDPLMDFGVWRSTDEHWLEQFGYTKQDLIDGGVDSITKMIDYLLEQFYRRVADAVGDTPTIIIDGPSKLNVELLSKYGLAYSDSWTTTLVESYEPTYLESSIELDYATQWLINTYPSKSRELKSEFIDYVDQIDEKIALYKEHPDMFAYHHPTVSGNKLFYRKIRERLQCQNVF